MKITRTFNLKFTDGVGVDPYWRQEETYHCNHPSRGIHFTTRSKDSAVELVRLLLLEQGESDDEHEPSWDDARQMIDRSVIDYEVEGLAVSRQEFTYWQNDPELDLREDGSPQYTEEGIASRRQARSNTRPLPAVVRKVVEAKRLAAAQKARARAYFKAGAVSFSPDGNDRHEVEIYFRDQTKADAFPLLPGEVTVVVASV